MNNKERFQKFIEYFEKNIPDANTELYYSNPYELLVSVILSAQCTDKRVNLTTPAFFKQFPSPNHLAVSTSQDVFPFIKSISYPNNKSKHLVGMAKMLVNDFKGIVPDDVVLLQKLPGVGRKTANVIASIVYHLPKMAVDTHVHRVSARIGLTRNAKTVLQTEHQLIKNLPKNKIRYAHHWLILHGRYICNARKPKCEKCGISDICNYFNKK